MPKQRRKKQHRKQRCIADYLAKHSLSQGAFAKLFKPAISQGLVWQWIDGRTSVSLEYAKEIERITRGEVTRQILFPEMYEKVAA